MSKTTAVRRRLSFADIPPLDQSRSSAPLALWKLRLLILTFYTIRGSALDSRRWKESGLRPQRSSLTSTDRCSPVLFNYRIDISIYLKATYLCSFKFFPPLMSHDCYCEWAFLCWMTCLISFCLFRYWYQWVILFIQAAYEGHFILVGTTSFTL